MDDTSHENRTEAPTPRRRESAREEGQVVFSPDLTAGIVLLAVAIGVRTYGTDWMTALSQTVIGQLSGLSGDHWGMSESVFSARWLAGQLLALTGAVLIGLWVLNTLLAMVQVGPSFQTSALALKPERLLFESGWRRMWSFEGLTRGGAAGLKFVVVVIAGVLVFTTSTSELLSSTRGGLRQSVVSLGDLSTTLLLVLAAVGVVSGAADFAFRWFRHERGLRMTREEIRQEMKEDTGNPQLKQRMRKQQQESRKRKSLQDVPTATAVITNPTHFAVALRYEVGRDKAPTVVCRGTDAFARRIIAVAKEAGVPVMERPPLARALFAMTQIGDEIPLDMYRAVAEVLTEIYRRKGAA